MALDIKKIIKQEVAKVMLEQHLLEAETPDHFGGGENIDVFGYQTEHFDICKSAVMLFTKLKEKNLEGMAVDHAKKAAQHIDNVFGIEKDVVEEGSAAPEQMEEAVDSNMLFGYEIGALSMHIDEDLTRDTAFHKLHIMEIANRFQGNMSGNVTESINEAPMDKRFAKEYEKSGKALRNHIKHEMGKGTVYTANQKRELQKLDQIIKLAIDVPNNMAKIIDEPGKVRTESKINENPALRMMMQKQMDTVTVKNPKTKKPVKVATAAKDKNHPAHKKAKGFLARLRDKLTKKEHIEILDELLLNEISVKAGLEDVIKGRTSAIEGIKMSKDLAQGFQQWIAMSPYGRKYGKHINKGRIASVIGPANAFGIERYLSPKAKKEFKDVYKKHKPKREVVEGKINEITVKAGLEDVIKGRTSAIEGVEMSKDLAKAIKTWINMSAFGQKYKNQILKGRIGSLIKPMASWGLDRYLDGNTRPEFKHILSKAQRGLYREAAPGYMHDCASRVIHMEHGAGTCIPEQHNLVKEGKKWVVTEYDVEFDSGKIVKNVPVNELKIVSESHHGHKRRKKKKTNEMKVTNHKGENITKYVLQLLQGKINQKQFEKLTGLKKDKMKELKEKLVFYRDEKKRLRRFDTDKAANRRLSR